MTGFGIIDTSCTPEGYAYIRIPETAESIAYMRYLEREWPVLFFSARRLRVYVVAASITFILGYQIGISAGLTITDSFLTAFFQTSGDYNPSAEFNLPGLPLFISSFYTAALAAWIVTPCWLNGGMLLEMRKRMVLASLCLRCGATLTCSATTLTILVAGRMLLGFGIGVSLHTMPIYVSRITPMNPRLLFHVFQFVVCLGIICASNTISLGWRVGLGCAILPALASLAFSTYLPNSVDEEEQVCNDSKRPWTELFLNKKNRPHLVTAFLLPLLQQLSGISLMVLFTPMMARAAGDHGEGMIKKMGFNTVFWLYSRMFCEVVVPIAKMSRRKLVLTFGVLMVIFDYNVANPIGWFEYGNQNLWLSSNFIHVGCSVWEYISWTFLNETLPREIRGVAWRLSMSVVLIFYALVAHFGLPLFAYLQLDIFDIMYRLVIVGMLIFYALLPDNKWSILRMGPVVYLWDNHSFWKGSLTRGDDQNTALRPGLHLPL